MTDEPFPNPSFLAEPPAGTVLRAVGSRVEAAGGRLLPEPCRGEDIVYKVSGIKRAAESCGCGNVTRMALPAESPMEGDPAPIFATVCAVCDSVADMPRFGATR